MEPEPQPPKSMPAPESVKRIIADKYEVRGVLGEGGTGIVYDAVTKDGKAVALKVMHDALAGDKQIRGRFQREAAILRRLEGAHVAPIMDFGELPGEEPGTSVLYIALPKIEGESLEDLLARELIDVDRALDIMLEVLQALKAAHGQGIIHRDLKPANVLMQKQGDGKPAKAVVVDFGMSKIITGGGLGTTNLTTHNMVFGTPEYMSPEQARGDELDARCDIYACGVMLYEMLTGAPPFTGATPLNVLTAHLTSELEAPSTRPKAVNRVSVALESVIVNALARDRDARYASASALAAAIRHARAAPNDVSSLRPEAFSDAPPGTDAFAATIPAVPSPIDPIDVTAPTLISTAPLAPSQKPSASAPPPSSVPAATSRPSQKKVEPESGNRIWIMLWVLVGLASIGIGVYFALRP